MSRAHFRICAAVIALAAGAGCRAVTVVPVGPGEVRLRPGEEVVLDGSGSFDPEGEELAYRWRQVAGPEADLRDADTPWPRFTPPAPGRYEFILVVAAPPEGGDGPPVESPPARIAIDVLPPNRPPRIELPREIRAEPGQWVVLDGGGAADPDGDALSFKWERVVEKDGAGASPAAFVEMDPYLGDARRVRARAWRPGKYRFRLTVTDALGAEATAETVLRVAPNDLAPVAIPRVKGPGGSGLYPLRLQAWPHPKGGVNLPPEAAVRVEYIDDGPVKCAEVVLDATASRDPNGDALEYRWRQVAGPTVRVLRSDRQAGLARVRFEPPAGGRYVIQLVVTDGVLESDPVEAAFVVPGAEGPVADPPGARRAPVVPLHVDRRPPDASLTADAGEDVFAETGSEVMLLGGARSAPRDAGIEYSWRQVSGPRVRSFRFGGFDEPGRPRFTPVTPGRYVLELRVSADGVRWSAPDRVTVTAVGANRPPWLRAPPEIEARPGETVRVALVAGDPDGDEVAAEWRAPAGRVELSAGEACVEIVAPEEGAVAVEAVARDGRGAEAREVVLVRVCGAGRAPVAVVSAPSPARPGRPVVLDGTESYDPEGGELAYRWDIAGPAIMRLDGADRARARFVPPGPGKYEFSLVVASGGRKSSAARVTVNVEMPGREGGGMVVAPVPPRVTRGRPVVLDASRSRTGRLRPRVRWRQLEGPEVELPEDGPRILLRPRVEGRYRFVAEAEGCEAHRAVSFQVVAANARPVASARVRAGRGGRVVLDGSRSRDPEGAPLLYRWVEVGGSRLPLREGLTRDRRLTLREVPPGRHRVRLVVTDGERVSRSGVVEFETKSRPRRHGGHGGEARLNDERQGSARGPLSVLSVPPW